MIVALEGEVIKKEPTSLHIKTKSGLVYLVKVSLNSSPKITTDRVYLHTTLIIKEDSHTLYGFIEPLEKTMFDRVIKINGVGPSTALAICSTFTPEAFAEAVTTQDLDSIKLVPGIGPKSAKRILIELGDFILVPKEESIDTKSKKDAILALESLGFKKDKIQKALKDSNSKDTGELIKEALKRLT